MNIKYAIVAMASFLAIPSSAQETYENARLAETELNGTARYVGMGGALEALGADISTIKSNPAGLGLFRRPTANVSFGFVSQQGAGSYDDANSTNASFDQLGFVYSMRNKANSFINIGVNYSKSTNFDFILSAANTLNGCSQNKQSYGKGLLGSVNSGGFNVGKNSNDEYLGYENSSSQYTARTFSQVDYLYWNVLLADQDGNYGYNDATGYVFGRSNKGYIGAYDFNISGNINDRVFLGLTLGVRDVNYRANSTYRETITGNAGNGDMTLVDSRHIDGNGVNVSAGIIFRPVESSPFRIGAYIVSPTWYDLTTSNTTRLDNGSSYGLYDNGNINESYDFKVRTPFRFGFSLGHTVGDYLALGATYEYSDYSTMDSRINTGSGYDYYYDDYYETSESDDVMNNHTERTLKGVSTLKLGLEYKPVQNLAVRMGYNYVSSMFNKNGFKDSGLDSEGVYYSSSTDYTNWKDTNRFTCGLGYTFGKFTADMAYQYSATNGDFYPFTPMSYNGETNNVAPASVSNKRHQVLFTLGYRF